jgi:hypothetical protein
MFCILVIIARAILKSKAVGLKAVTGVEKLVFLEQIEQLTMGIFPVLVLLLYWKLFVRPS